jgi:peptidoglycan hydrolase-like protein with peptidoglycan-binding domain
MEYTQKGAPEASMPTPNQNKQEAIRNLQRYLRQLYFSEESIPEVPVDGVFDSATEASLRAFQRSRGLPET